MTESELKNIARKAKLLVLDMISKTKTAHIGSSFSAIDILTAVYFAALNVDPKNPFDPGRDRFILSKGHAAAGLYAILALRGFINEDILEGYYKNGGFLPGHASRGRIPGIESSTGSLGHGLPVGAGMALAAKKDNQNSKTYILLGDGECNEGSIWEAVLFAGHNKLDNLVAVIDYNKWQSFGRNEDVLDLEPFMAKWNDFKWSVKEVDGHDVSAVATILRAAPFEKNKPSIIIAHTIKGKDLGSLEDKMESHYWPPKPEELESIRQTINRT